MLSFQGNPFIILCLRTSFQHNIRDAISEAVHLKYYFCPRAGLWWTADTEHGDCMWSRQRNLRVMPSLEKHCRGKDYTFIYKPCCSVSLEEKLTSHFTNLILQEVLKGVRQVHGSFRVTESSAPYCRRACQTLSTNNLGPLETEFSWTPFFIPSC